MKTRLIKYLTPDDIGKVVILPLGQGTLVDFNIDKMIIVLLNLNNRIRTYSVTETTKILVEG